MTIEDDHWPRGKDLVDGFCRFLAALIALGTLAIGALWLLFAWR